MITINETIKIPGFVIHSEEFMQDKDDYIKRLEQKIKDLEKEVDKWSANYRGLSTQTYGYTNP